MRKAWIIVVAICLCLELPFMACNRYLRKGQIANTGDIEGMAYDCDRNIIPFALIQLNLMPDSILKTWTDTLKILYYRTFFDDLRVDSTIADSLGRFAFRNVPVGYYQLVCAGTTRRMVSEEEDQKAPDDSLSGMANDTAIQLYGPDSGKFMIVEIPDHLLKEAKSIYGPPAPCGRGPLDMVRVANDSISIADLRLRSTDSRSGSPPWARFWSENYKSRIEVKK